MVRILFAVGCLAVGTGFGGVYTNVAGNVSVGVPVALTRAAVTLSNETRTATLKLSVFPVSERRRIVLDFARANPDAGGRFVRLPPNVEAAIRGSERRIAASQARAQKGFKTKEDDAAFCAKTRDDLEKYIAKQIERGVITQEEYDLWRASPRRTQKIPK